MANYVCVCIVPSHYIPSTVMRSESNVRVQQSSAHSDSLGSKRATHLKKKSCRHYLFENQN